MQQVMGDRTQLEQRIFALTVEHRDLDDVIRLIRVRALGRDFANQLDPYVRAKFDELWRLAQHPDEDY